MNSLLGPASTKSQREINLEKVKFNQGNEHHLEWTQIIITKAIHKEKKSTEGSVMTEVPKEMKERKKKKEECFDKMKIF